MRFLVAVLCYAVLCSAARLAWPVLCWVHAPCELSHGHFQRAMTLGSLVRTPGRLRGLSRPKKFQLDKKEKKKKKSPTDNG